MKAEIEKPTFVQLMGLPILSTQKATVDFGLRPSLKKSWFRVTRPELRKSGRSVGIFFLQKDVSYIHQIPIVWLNKKNFRDQTQ